MSSPQDEKQSGDSSRQETAIGLSADSTSPIKKNSIWGSLRAGVKRRNPISKWLSDEERLESKWPDDARESHFCNALVALMHRSGRYHDSGQVKEENLGPERKKRKPNKATSVKQVQVQRSSTES